MKFEKFLKSCGTHGQIVKRDNGDKWLVCGGVGMLIPIGVVNLLGAGEVGEKTREILEAIVTADTDEKIQLKEAYLPADGKASDIIRIFSDGYNRVRIHNADFGLLEKSDYDLAYLETEVENEDVEDDLDGEFSEIVRYLLVVDRKGEVIGFITGVPEK